MLAPPRAAAEEEPVAYPFVESPNVTRRASRPIDVVVMHTMEIAERPDAAAICARWFATEASQVSAHYCVDAGTVIQCVREHNIAWHARGGNTDSIGVELAGFASQTRRDWADAYSNALLRRASTLVGDICSRRTIPVRWLVADDLVAGRRGITGTSRSAGRSTAATTGTRARASRSSGSSTTSARRSSAPARASER